MVSSGHGVDDDDNNIRSAACSTFNGGLERPLESSLGSEGCDEMRLLELNSNYFHRFGQIFHFDDLMRISME